MRTALWLAWRCLLFHRWRSPLIVAALGTTLALPAAVHAVIQRCDAELRARAAATPALIGAPGSRYDLLLHALYFRGAPPPLPFREVRLLAETGLASPIPLLVPSAARGAPIVGTTPEYYAFRALRTDAGRLPARIGEAVAGAAAAADLGLRPGADILSDAGNLFDLRAALPLKLQVVGVLARSGTADDAALFVDLKTAWILAGLGHGHEDLAAPEQSGKMLRRDGRDVVASAGVQAAIEITPENVVSFHFHGDLDAFPVGAILAVSCDEKSRVLLAGRSAAQSDRQHLIPEREIDELMDTVFSVRRLLDAQSLAVVTAAALLLAVIVALTVRLREREMQTYHKLGCRRGTQLRLVAAELSLLLSFSAAGAAAFAIAARSAAPTILRWWLSRS